MCSYDESKITQFNTNNFVLIFLLVKFREMAVTV